MAAFWSGGFSCPSSTLEQTWVLLVLTALGVRLQDRAQREDIMMVIDAGLPPPPPPPPRSCEPPTNVDDGCAEVGACMDGYDLALGEVDPETCEAQCPCVERDPLEPGPVGRYNDLVVVDGVAWVSAYSELYGDLVVGEHRGVGGFRWHWVDGVPADGEVVAGPTEQGASKMQDLMSGSSRVSLPARMAFSMSPTTTSINGRSNTLWARLRTTRSGCGGP